MLAHLYRRAGTKPSCYPGAEDIRRACRISDDALWPALRVLESRGLIIRKKHRYNANEYFLVVPDVTPEIPVTVSPAGAGQVSPGKTGEQSPAVSGEPSPGKTGCKGIEEKEEHEGKGGRTAPAADSRSIPWLSLTALPDDLRAFAVDIFSDELGAGVAYDEIVGRKLRFGDTQPSVVAWAAVIRAELRDVARKQPKRRHAHVGDGSDPEPPGWQAFVDEHLQGAHATGGMSFGPWATKDPSTRAQIRHEMEKHSRRAESTVGSNGDGQAA